MCLAIIKWNSESVKDAVELTGIGYKLFYVDEHGHLKGQHFIFKGSLRKNRWIKDTSTCMVDCYIGDGLYQTYPCGFHIYMTLDSAKRQMVKYRKCFSPSRDDIIIKKVMFRKIVAFGQQSSESVVVAREIKILEK